MYFRYGGGIGAVTGGHNVMGARRAAAGLVLRRGHTGAGFDEYLTLMNPTATSRARCALTYYVVGEARRASRRSPSPANSRDTVVVHDGGRGRRARQDASGRRSRATNGVGLVVERPMYFRYSADASTAATT